MPSNHLILCHPLLLPSIFPSIKVFSNESALHIRWPKYWSFSFNISPSNEYWGLISFRMDWLDLLAVHRTLKSLKSLLTESRDQSLSLCLPWPKAPFPCTVPVAEARGAGPPARWSRCVERCTDSAAPAGLLAAAIPPGAQAQTLPLLPWEPPLHLRKGRGAGSLGEYDSVGFSCPDGALTECCLRKPHAAQ